jgi:hypothetical protein
VALFLVAAMAGSSSCSGSASPMPKQRTVAMPGVNTSFGDDDSSWVAPPPPEASSPIILGDEPPVPPPMPAVSCEGDSGDAVSPDCPSPASQCIGTQWLLEWTNGRCVAGQCVYDPYEMNCWGLCTTYEDAGECLPVIPK